MSGFKTEMRRIESGPPDVCPHSEDRRADGLIGDEAPTSASALIIGLGCCQVSIPTSSQPVCRLGPC